MNNNYSVISDVKNVRKFLFGGNSTITIESGKTGKYFTFKVKVANKSDNKSPYFVSVLCGTDNYTNYSYVGMISNNEFKLTSKSTVNKDSLSYKAFKFFFDGLVKESIHNDLRVYHSGKCARCSKKLTTPESITLGFGPECIKKASREA